MEGMPVVMVVVSLGLVLGIFGAVGVFDVVNGPTTHIEEEVGDVAQDQNTSEIDPDEAGEGGFVSFTVGAVRLAIDMVYLVAFLPSTLVSLGVPAAVAPYIGHGAQIVVGVMVANAWLGDGFR